MTRGSIKVAVAESLTGGMLSSDIVSRSGASKYFVGGTIAYSLDSKVNLLGVDREHAAATDCVSEKVAAQMAAGVAKAFGADVGVSTTGFAEPHEDHPQHAFVGLHMRDTEETVVRHISLDTDGGPPTTRNDFRRRVSHLALAMLNEYANVTVG
jgi:PncC family amidohydrolase